MLEMGSSRNHILASLEKLYVERATWVNVVRCLRLAGVGHEAVVGVCPACWGNEEMPLPGDETPPDRDDSPEFGSGFSFLNAPSAVSQIELIFST